MKHLPALHSLATLLVVLAQSQAAAPARVQPTFEAGPLAYNYSPCLLRLSPTVRHLWYCANQKPGEVTDVILHRRGHLVDGSWAWSEPTLAIVPSARPAWDSRHVCDPEVVPGRFRYQGATWRYALLYLGCDAERSTHNQVGVAFSRSPEGPWTRYPHPLVAYTPGAHGGVIDHQDGWPVYRWWGVGQPTAVPMASGRILLLFSRGEDANGEEMAMVDLGDMDRGPVVSGRRPVVNDGLGSRWLTNAGIAYDRTQRTIIMVRECLPPTDSLSPSFIAAQVEIASIPVRDLVHGTGRWQIIGAIGEAQTGWARNHNASLERDTGGRSGKDGSLVVALSLAPAYPDLPPDARWLWRYRIGLVDLPAAARRPVPAGRRP